MKPLDSKFINYGKERNCLVNLSVNVIPISTQMEMLRKLCEKKIVAVKVTHRNWKSSRIGLAKIWAQACASAPAFPIINFKLG